MIDLLDYLVDSMLVNTFGFVFDNIVVGGTVKMVEMKENGQMMREHILQKYVPEIVYEFVVDTEVVLVVDDTGVLDSTMILDTIYSY